MTEDRIRLLLVEDNPGDALLVGEVLDGSLEVECEIVRRLGPALAHLATHETDVVLLDLGLPDSQGLDTLKAVARTAPQVPVVVLTGQDDESTGRAAVHHGAQDYLTKNGLAGPALVRAIRYAIERSESRATLQQLNDVLRSVRNVAELIIHEKDPQRLTERACEMLVETRGYLGAWLALTRDTGKAWATASAGFGGRFDVLATRMGEGRWPPCCERARAAESGPEVVVVPTATCRDCPLNSREVGCAGAVTALRHEGRIYGFLGVSLPQGFEFDGGLLVELADDLAFAVHGAEIEAHRRDGEAALRESMRRLRTTFDGVIQTLMRAIETRDPCTAGHQRRVADLGGAIAEELGLPADTIEAVRLAATIHDLGKIAVPAEILAKPAKLTKMEFGLIQAHCRAAYEMLGPVEFPWPLPAIVLQHHERLDGSGYPDALRGDAIRLEARIIAVADVVEAMSSHRPYRPALGTEAALAEITRQRGVRLDADAVDACLRLFREKGYNLPT